MNNKSAVFRIIYYADRQIVKTQSRLHALMYLTSNEVDLDLEFNKTANNATLSLFSQDVEDAVEDLESHRLIETVTETTYGGEERNNYQLTQKGADKAETLITGNDQDELIKDLCEEHNDTPVSNLLSDIRDSEPAHKWS